MKGVCLLLSVGLASAINIARQEIQAEGAESNVLNGSAIANSTDIAGVESPLVENVDEVNINDLNSVAGLNLDDLNIDGLDTANLDPNSQDDLAQAILSMLGALCLNAGLNQNNLLNLGLDNELELLLELTQLIQLQQLGFIGGAGIRGLFNSGLLLGNFNFGVFKRALAEAKKSMRRTKLRRGTKVKRQNCAELDAAPIASVDPAAVAEPVASSASAGIDATAAVGSIATPVATAQPAAVDPAAEEAAADDGTATAPVAPTFASPADDPNNTLDIVLDNPEG